MNKVRLDLEALDDRLVPAVDAFIWFRSGVVAVAPPSDPAPAHTVDIHHQVGAIDLPTGDTLAGHGLKTAEAHNPVIDWTPT